NRGGQADTIKGTNFSPDILVVIAGVIINNRTVADTQTITFTTPALPSGRNTVTASNRGGSAQIPLIITSSPLSQLPVGYITTVAGGSTFAGEGSPATAVPINPLGITVDAAGNVFFVDQANRK